MARASSEESAVFSIDSAMNRAPPRVLRKPMLSPKVGLLPFDRPGAPPRSARAVLWMRSGRCSAFLRVDETQVVGRGRLTAELAQQRRHLPAMVRAVVRKMQQRVAE